MRKLALCLLLATACTREAVTTPPTATVAGHWDLHSIAGQHLPLMIMKTVSASSDLVSDVVTLESGGTYAEVMRIRNTTNGVSIVEQYDATGTYVVQGSAVTLRTPDGVVTTGTFEGNTISLDEGGHLFVYKRK